MHFAEQQHIGAGLWDVWKQFEQEGVQTDAQLHVCCGPTSILQSYGQLSQQWQVAPVLQMHAAPHIV